MLFEEISYPGGTRVLLWRLEEDVPQLLALCREAGVPVDDLTTVPPKRQRERAAERLLLARACGGPVTLGHDGQGAPLVGGREDMHISISHTPRLVVLAWSNDQVIGVDAEAVDRRQVLRVRDKFLNDSEQAFLPADDLVAHIIAWTAKEAIIKAERNSAIDWTHGIVLEPFSPEGVETHLGARCGNVDYLVVARLVEDHYITLAVPR